MCQRAIVLLATGLSALVSNVALAASNAFHNVSRSVTVVRAWAIACLTGAGLLTRFAVASAEFNSDSASVNRLSAVAARMACATASSIAGLALLLVLVIRGGDECVYFLLESLEMLLLSWMRLWEALSCLRIATFYINFEVRLHSLQKRHWIFSMTHQTQMERIALTTTHTKT